MPGNPFNSVWPRSPLYDGNVTEEMRLAALTYPPLAEADLNLCGHAITPYVQPEILPNGRRMLVVRSSGWPRQDDGVERASVAILTRRPAGWQITLDPLLVAPRDPARA